MLIQQGIQKQLQVQGNDDNKNKPQQNDNKFVIIDFDIHGKKYHVAIEKVTESNRFDSKVWDYSTVAADDIAIERLEDYIENGKKSELYIKALLVASELDRQKTKHPEASYVSDLIVVFHSSLSQGYYTDSDAYKREPELAQYIKPNENKIILFTTTKFIEQSYIRNMNTVMHEFGHGITDDLIKNAELPNFYSKDVIELMMSETVRDFNEMLNPENIDKKDERNPKEMTKDQFKKYMTISKERIAKYEELAIHCKTLGYDKMDDHEFAAKFVDNQNMYMQDKKLIRLLNDVADIDSRLSKYIREDRVSNDSYQNFYYTLPTDITEEEKKELKNVSEKLNYYHDTDGRNAIGNMQAKFTHLKEAAADNNIDRYLKPFYESLGSDTGEVFPNKPSSHPARGEHFKKKEQERLVEAGKLINKYLAPEKGQTQGEINATEMADLLEKFEDVVSYKNKDKAKDGDVLTLNGSPVPGFAKFSPDVPFRE